MNPRFKGRSAIKGSDRLLVSGGRYRDTCVLEIPRPREGRPLYYYYYPFCIVVQRHVLKWLLKFRADLGHCYEAVMHIEMSPFFAISIAEGSILYSISNERLFG